MNIRSVNRATRVLTALAATVALGTVGLGSASASEVPAAEESQTAVAEPTEDAAAPGTEEAAEGTAAQTPEPDALPDATLAAPPEVMQVENYALRSSAPGAPEGVTGRGVLPTQLIVNSPPSTVWTEEGSAPVTISVDNDGTEASSFVWTLEKIASGPLTSACEEVPGGAQEILLYNAYLEVGEYHFWTEGENVENGDFTFEVRQIAVESAAWEEDPVDVNAATGVADGVLTGVVTGHEADGIHATVILDEEGIQVQSDNGSETPLAIEPDGSFQHTFVGLEPGRYQPTILLYQGDDVVLTYEDGEPLEVLGAHSDPEISEAAFNPATVSVCPGGKAGSTLVGKLTNWSPNYKLAVEFFADYDLDNDDFELLETALDVEVAPDGTFSFTTQPVGVGEYSADITVYMGDWEDNDWVDIKGFVPFTVTEKDCTTPGGQAPGDGTPAAPDKDPTAEPTSQASSEATLPKTGVSSAGLLALLGAGLVGAGSVILVRRRRA